MRAALGTLERLRSNLLTAQTFANKLLHAPGAAAASTYSTLRGGAIATVGAFTALQGDLSKGASLLAAGTIGMASGAAGFYEVFSEADPKEAALQFSQSIRLGLTEMGNLQEIHKNSLTEIELQGTAIKTSASSLDTSIKKLQLLLADPIFSGDEERAELSKIEVAFRSLSQELEGKLTNLFRTHTAGNIILALIKLRLSQLAQKGTLSEEDLASLATLTDPLTHYFSKMDQSIKSALAISNELEALHRALSELSSKISAQQAFRNEQLREEVAKQQQVLAHLAAQAATLDETTRRAQNTLEEMEVLNHHLQKEHHKLQGSLEKLLKQLFSMKAMLATIVGIGAALLGGILLARTGRMVVTAPLVGLVATGLGLVAQRRN